MGVIMSLVEILVFVLIIIIVLYVADWGIGRMPDGPIPKWILYLIIAVIVIAAIFTKFNLLS